MSIKQHEPNEVSLYNQQKAAINRFNAISKELQQLFNLDPIDQYHQIQWLTTPIELNNPRFGCSESIDANNQLILQISAEFLTNSNSLIDSVLWRENFLLYLPQRVRLVPEAADLGLYCYHKYGIKTQRTKQRFKQIWSTVSPPQGTLYYRYYPAHGFHYFDNVVDGTFLQKAIKWLRPFNDIPGPMSSETYITNLERWMFNYHRRLKPLELKVLRGLNNCLDCSQTKLAQKLELRQPTVSRVIRTLSEKHLMRFVTIENYPILGLQPIVVDFSIENISVITKLSKLLVKVQYLLGLQEFDDHLLVYFVIPNRRILRLRRWVKQLVSLLDLSPPKIWTITEKTHFRNFDLYDAKNGVWSFNYEPIIENVIRLIQEDWTQQFPQLQSFTFSSSHESTPIDLQPEDFIYMKRATDAFLLTDKVRFYEAQEARLAGFSSSEYMTYRRRVEFLERKEVMSSPIGIGLFNIGLDAVVNIIIEGSTEETRKILTALQLLPHVSGNIFDNGNGSASLLVPKGAAIEINSSLDTLLTNCGISTISAIKPAWEAYGWAAKSPVSVSNYNFQRCDWIWTKDTLPLPTS